MDMLTQFHTAGDEAIIVANTQDVEPILHQCKALHNSGMVGDNEMYHAASLPLVLVENYCNQKGITFQEWMRDEAHIKSMLNDPDLKGFRVWQGAI